MAESPPVGSADTVLLLADTASSVQRFVSVFFEVYILLILAYVLTSWIRMPYALHRVQRFLDDVCEPYIRIFRRCYPRSARSTCLRSSPSSRSSSSSVCWSS